MERDPVPGRPRMIREVEKRERRKMRARKKGWPGIWSGLGMLGLVGWTVTLPALIGTGIGIWLDRRYPAHHSWTLGLLLAGLALGCLNAWNWISRENKEIKKDLEDPKHDT